MKISFILSSLWLSGGVRVVIQYANRLVDRGHQLSFIVPGGTIDPKVGEEINPEIRIIETKQTLEQDRTIPKLLRLCWEMANAVPFSDVIIATHTPTTAVSYIANKILNRGKIIWYYMDYEIMFEGRPIERWLLRNALRWHAYALTLSEACKSELISFVNGKVNNIGLGIDTFTYFPIQTAQKSNYGYQDKNVIFFLGDPRPRKGMADFLAAAEKLIGSVSDLFIWIASKEDIEIKTSLPYRLFIRPPDDELANLYSACDVFVSASWYEGFGLPPLEAMACGAPVVTTDSKGIREFAIDGQNCLIVPPKDPDALAMAILSLISNQELLDRFRINGPITAAKYDWDKATDRFEAALDA